MVSVGSIWAVCRSGGVAERRSLSGGRDVEAAFAQPVALALEGDHGGVVDEPVDQGGGDHRVAEDLAPLLEAAVRGDDDRAAFVAARDEREEQVGGLAFERQVADLVDDQQVVALEPAQLVLELVAVLRGFRAARPTPGRWRRRRGSRARRPSCASAIARWVLPVPGGPKKQTLARSSIQASWARCMHERPLGGGLRLQSKSSSVFSAGKAAWRMRCGRRRRRARTPRPRAASRGTARRATARSRARAAVCSSRSQHARRLQLREQVGQPLADAASASPGLMRTAPRSRRARAARPRRPRSQPARPRGGGSGRMSGGGSQLPCS